MTFSGARDSGTIQVTWVDWSPGPVACKLPVHHHQDWLGTGDWESGSLEAWKPGSSSLPSLGELGKNLDILELRVLQLQELQPSGNCWAGHQEVRRPSSTLAREEMNPSAPQRLSQCFAGTPRWCLAASQPPAQCMQGWAWGEASVGNWGDGLLLPSIRKYSPAAIPKQGTGDTWNTKLAGCDRGCCWALVWDLSSLGLTKA